LRRGGYDWRLRVAINERYTPKKVSAFVGFFLAFIDLD
jgi:hypothetical protein